MVSKAQQPETVEQQIEIILGELRRGNTRGAAAAAAHIRPKIFKQWCAQSEDVAQRVYEAEMAWQRSMVAKVSEAGLRWTAYMTLLERRYPEEFGRPERLPTAQVLHELRTLQLELETDGINVKLETLIADYNAQQEADKRRPRKMLPAPVKSLRA